MGRKFSFRQQILLLTLLIYSSAGAQSWDERPATDYKNRYSQEFNSTSGWERFTFYNQWNTLQSRVFSASDISTGALQFKWIEKRVMCSKEKYAQPYIFEADYDYSNGSNRGGVVIRIANLTESIQEPDHDPGFNREGVAFYPTSDGNSMIVQFSGEDKGAGGGTAFTRIYVPKPNGVNSLFDRKTLRIEDFGTSIYVFYNESPFIRIDLDDINEDLYTSGTVYNASMQTMGSFAGMEVEATGHVAIAQRDALLRLYRATIQYNDITEVFNPADTIIFESPYRDLYTDTWVATDALGRRMPDYDDVGEPKDDKRRVVGIFYITWHTQGHHTNFTSPYSADVTKILKADPSARFDAYHPLWATNSFHWGEPEMGYFLSQDEYVIRKDMAMLANAGVDVLIMDVTNAVRYWDEWEVLFKTMQKIKAEGNQVPKFCFWAFNGPVISVVQDLYDWFYKTERYKDLWFYWDDKPLLLYNANPSVDATGGGYTNPNPNYDPDAVSNPSNPHYGDPYYTEEFLTDYTQEVKEFFTKRNMWWGYYNWAGTRYVGTEDNWSFGYQMDDVNVKNMDPDDLVATHNGRNEQAAVTPAQHPSSLVGKSWSRVNGEPELNEYDMPKSTYVPWLNKTVENPEAYGIYFQERWDEAIQSDPEFIYINDWNEWTAGKYHDGLVNPFMRRNSPYYFVDQYNAEFNRCVQPMKDGYTDNYYMQMVQNIRRYKGVRQHSINKGISNLSVDNDFSDWEQLPNEFRDAIGDTRHRKHNGYGGLEYINTTGRNDIMSSKVGYDNDSLYFYVKTLRDLSPSDDPNWMLLFIDADKNKETGWEGYDYLINKNVNSSTQTTLMQWTGSAWGNEVAAPFAFRGNEMEIGIPRSAMNMKDDTPEFYFKWADNPQHLNDISDFFTDGESAPDRRFNYNFSPKDATTDLSENRLNSDFVKVYPNPANNSVRIEASESSSVEVYNLTGQMIYSSHHPFKELEIDVSGWEPGLYVLRGIRKEGGFVKKLIVE
ncbi:T9SS type A sorting domain-containing protein [uncultured Sunxiuqinia sp.]|uniref:T9SS type A sorting domain-containing protein n=1 Tax=uncultured Sunxiuqinia sp. TaxID=1573825 RepID=UPI0030DADA31